jgi:hypothetical protein
MYDIGDMVRFTAQFYNANDVLTDPSTVGIKLLAPDNSEVTYAFGTDPELTRESAGIYQLDLKLEQAGRYFYRWEGAGVVTSAEEEEFYVRLSRF